MVFQHLADFFHDLLHGVYIGIANADGFGDAAVGHAGRVFHRDGGEYRVGHIQGALVESANGGQAPANVLHDAFNVTVRRADPVTDLERTVQVNDEAAKEVGQQVLGGKADRDTTHTTKGQNPGNTEAQGLQGGQHRGDDNNRAQQLADSVHRGVIHRLTHFDGRCQDLFDFLHQAEQEPDQHPDKADLQHRAVGLEDFRVTEVMGHLGCPVNTLQPDKRHHGPAGGMQEGIVPFVFSRLELVLDGQNQPADYKGNGGRAQNQEEYQDACTPPV